MLSLKNEVVYYDEGRILVRDDVCNTVAPRKKRLAREENEPLTRHYHEYPDGNTKKYVSTRQAREIMFGVSTGSDLDEFDLCPDVSLWCGKGVFSATPDRAELFFNIESEEQLRSVADYYGQPYPLNDELDREVFSSKDLLCYRMSPVGPILLGAVDMLNGGAVQLKVYTYTKDFYGWNYWMTGRSYMDGGMVWEEGAVYHKQTGGVSLDRYHMRGEAGASFAESIVSEKSDGSVVQYVYTEEVDDPLPLAYWVGHEVAPDGSKRIKHFQTSQQLRMLICNLPTGDRYESYNLCPFVNLWMGHSWYEGEDIVELYFMAEDSTMVENVAIYYGLSVPYDEKLKMQLDNDPVSMRVRHYDVLGEGEGNFVPVVVCGVEFTGEKATALRLYSFGR